MKRFFSQNFHDTLPKFAHLFSVRMFTCGSVMLLALCIALFLPVVNMVKPEVEETIQAIDVGVNIVHAASSSSRPFYRILNSVDGDVYIGSNETLIKLYVNGNTGGVEMRERTLVTEEELSGVSCAARYGVNKDVMCWNYLRIAEKTSSDRLLVCGTNAYSRRCYTCPKDNFSENCREVTIATNTIIPASPTSIPVAAVYPSPNGDSLFLYGGSVRDETFQRHTFDNITEPNEITLDLDTVTDQTGFIKAPTFVGKPYEDPNSNYVFVFYREIAVEYEKHGVKEYPRIARVCKNDTGGALNTKKFLTFVKARLNCSIPHKLIPFYFDELQDVVWNDYGNESYAIFTSHVLGPKASALCRFRKEDIMNLFDKGDAKRQQGNDVNRLWLPAKEENPRPGTCDGDHTTNYPPLMDKLVPNWNPDAPYPEGRQVQEPPPSEFPISRAPLFHLSGVRFTSLAIDFDYSTPIYFFGTSAGTVIKAFDDGGSYKHIEINDLVAEGPVTGLKLMTNAENTVKFLVITTEYNVITWSLTGNCAARSEKECRILRYPYCSLSADGKQCDCESSNCNDGQVGGGVLCDPTMDEMKSCDNADVYLYCKVCDNVVDQITLCWEKDGDEEFINTMGHLVIVNQVSDRLLELKVRMNTRTEGVYSCTAKNESMVLDTKRVTLIQQSCLTENSLEMRCNEYQQLKQERDNLVTGTCNVNVRDCDSCRLGVSP